MKYSIILIFLFITPFNLYGSTQLERIFGDGQNYNVLDMRGQQNARNGNSLSLIDNGYDLYKKRFELIHNAKKTIYISGLSLQDNEGGVIILRYLCWAGQKGVEVKILLDHFVSKKIQKYRKWLREDCGVKLVFFNPMRWGYSKIFTSLHEKLFLVDGEYGLIGGNGYSDNYLEASRESNRWHDLEMSISGPIVCQMQRVYAKTWKNVLKRHRKRIDYYDSFGDNLSYEEKRDLMYFEFDLSDPVKNCYEKKKGISNAVFLYNDPFFSSQRSQRNSSPTLEFYRKSILSLSPGELVSLYSPYMVPGKEFINILIKAVKKGIKVRVLTNSDSSNDESGVVVAASYMVARKLVKNGIDVFVWRKKSTMHRKGGVIGNEISFVGSDNLDNKGILYSTETILITDDKKIHSSMNEEFELDLKYSEKLTSKKIENYLENVSSLKKWLAKKFKFLM